MNARFNILIVDDDPGVRLRLRRILELEHHGVLEAENGEQGLQMVKQHNPDLILLDKQMPRLPGIECCRQLKNNPNTSDVPVIFLSGDDNQSSKIEGFKAGAVDYVTKPYHRVELLARIRVHLQLRAAYQKMVADSIAHSSTIQSAQDFLLPNPEDLPEARFHCIYAPLKNAGGDFYDVVATDGTCVDYFIADVSGHDLGAALPTFALKALYRQNADLLFPPKQNFTLLNRHMQNVFNECQYASAQNVRIDRSRGTMQVLNAGHVPPLVLRADGRTQWIEISGNPLGLFEECFMGEIEETIFPGDRVLLYSDAVIEYYKGQEVSRIDGMAHVEETVKALRAAKPATILKALQRTTFPDPQDAKDDLVLILIEA